MRDREEGEQSRKLFIGGLDYDTTDEKLRQHFEQWGELTDHVVMKFPDSKRSKGFGFVTYANNSSVDNCLDSMPHSIGGKTVEIKRATPREDDHGRRRGRARYDDDEEYDPESKQMRKLFVGGLTYQTSEEQLREYFEQYGDLVDSVVMKFPDSGRSRGFGFVTFEKACMVDKCQKARPHELDGKTIATKRATPKSDAGKPEARATVKKIFVGGLSEDIDDDDLRDYFGEFGKVTNVDQLRWNDTGKKRGFGFVEFDDHDAVDKIVLIPRHPVKDRKLEVKKALSKSEMEIVKKASENDRFGGGRDFGGSMGGGGGYNSRSMGMGGGNNMGMGMNNMGMGMGMNNMGMGMNSMGMGMNNMGMGMNNMGMGGGMGGNMGGGMGGNMGGGMGGGNMGAGGGNMGMGGGMGGNMGGGMGGNMGGGMGGGNMGGGGGNMGGANRRNIEGGDDRTSKSKSDQPVYSTNTGANPGYKTEGRNMGGGMGMGMNNMGMGGNMGGGMGMGMGMNNMGMGGGMGGSMGGGMSGGNMGGRSGGGPMRQGGTGGGGGGRDDPYSRGGSSSTGGRGGSRW